VLRVIVQYGTTPLIWACRKGHTDIVEMLLHAGAVADKAGMVHSFILPFKLLILLLIERAIQQ